MTYWKDQERRIKAVLDNRGWVKTRRQPGSGALAMENFKSDVWGAYPENGAHLMIDHKSTTGKVSARLNREELLRAMDDAEDNGDIGVVTFGYYQQRDLWGIMPLDKMMILIEEASQETIERISNGNR